MGRRLRMTAGIAGTTILASVMATPPAHAETVQAVYGCVIASADAAPSIYYRTWSCTFQALGPVGTLVIESQITWVSASVSCSVGGANGNTRYPAGAYAGSYNHSGTCVLTVTETSEAAYSFTVSAN